MLLVVFLFEKLKVLASCSYCHNLNDAQAAALPYTTNYRDNQCVMSVGDCLLVLLALWIIFFAAAVYFSNVWPNEHGVRRRYATNCTPAPKHFMVPSPLHCLPTPMSPSCLHLVSSNR